MIKKTIFFCFIFFIGGFKYSKAQNSLKTLIDVVQINDIKSIEEKIKIDGDLSERVWNSARFAGNFTQHYPYDTSYSITKTEYALYSDDKFLYAAFRCYRRNANEGFVVNNLKRDFSVLTNDAVILTISPFLDGQNGFSFGVTPHNAQREGSVENGGGYGVSTAWDQVWFSQTRITDSVWYAEMAIPFSSIRFVRGSKHWTFNVSRIDYVNNEISSLFRVPRNFNISSLVFADTLLWEKPIEKRPFNGVFIPYVSNLTSQPKGPNTPITQLPRIGFDAKLGITPSLNLDVTVNPDFAQVDVDVQQINLTRYSLFFPERRQFFIENSDLFANFGFRQIRPFFSRRVGLSDFGRNIPITQGLRLSGKYGNNVRLGIMNVTTADEEKYGGLVKNYSVFAMQRKIFKASNVGLIVVHDEKLNLPKRDFNTVLGTELNLLSPDNKWSGKAFVQKSHYPGLPLAKGYAHATYLMYRSLDWMFMWNHEFVSRRYLARTGFVPRIDNFDPSSGKVVKWDYWRLEPELKRVFYPKSKTINSVSAYVYNSSYYDSAFVPTESNTTLVSELKFQNTAYVYVTGYSFYSRLFLPFAPVSLPGRGYLTGEHQWQGVNIAFSTNTRKPLTVNGEVDFGGYYIQGNKQEYRTELNYRVPGLGRKRIPRLLVTASLRHIDIDLNDSGQYQIDLIGFKADYSLSTVTYLIGYWQYNAQNGFMNMNLRFQWRYRPMSDFFLVYSQNWDQTYLTPQSREAWSLGGRSLAFKAVYWF